MRDYSMGVVKYSAFVIDFICTLFSASFLGGSVLMSKINPLSLMYSNLYFFLHLKVTQEENDI